MDDLYHIAALRLTLRTSGAAMIFITRLLFAVIGLTSVLLGASYGVDAPKQTKGNSAKASRPETKPVHVVVRSRAEVKQTFTYSPYPAVPSELEGYAGSQTGGISTYRLSVDGQGAVNQVTILKGFTVTAVYDERFSDVKGEARVNARRGHLLEFWNTSVGELREIQCVTVTSLISKTV